MKKKLDKLILLTFPLTYLIFHFFVPFQVTNGSRLIKCKQLYLFLGYFDVTRPSCDANANIFFNNFSLAMRKSN